MNDFQPMPELTADQRGALEADIRAHGVLVPIVVDQHGRILDGHNRHEIAGQLGIECPREVREVADDDEAHDLAVTLNCARRHLTREQQREVIAAEATRRPEDSDRAIARRVGCSPSTVAAVRRPKVSKLDTPEDDPRRAEWLAEHWPRMAEQCRKSAPGHAQRLKETCMHLANCGAGYLELVDALMEGNRAELDYWASWGPEALEVIRAEWHLPVLRWIMSEDVAVALVAHGLMYDNQPPESVLQLQLDILAGRKQAWQLNDSKEFADWLRTTTEALWQADREQYAARIGATA